MSANTAGKAEPNKYAPFCDFDNIRKKDLERRKKLRLEQVCILTE